jgi:hypothetical protein
MYSDAELELRAEAGTATAHGRRTRVSSSAHKPDTAAAALAVWGDEEVASDVASHEALEGAQRPQEGQDMATATKKGTRKRPSKKATTKVDATATTEAAPESEAKPDKRKDAEARRARGGLEKLVVSVTDAYDEGKVDIGDKTLTPTRIAKIIGEKPGEDEPSAGAVAAILSRWDEMGYALTHEKPFAYKRVSAAGKKKGLEALKEAFKEKKKAERAAEREAAAAS